MSFYYVGGTLYDSNFLEHHGVIGQKWGIRRYVNSDGSLTPEGRRRYGNARGLGKYANNNSFVRRLASGEWGWGVKGYADEREQTLKNKINNSKNPKKTEKLKKKYDEQRKANIERNKMLSHYSTGKLIAQRILLGTYGSAAYRNERADGDNRYIAYKSAKAMQDRFGDPSYLDWYLSRELLKI